jgi:hypothetical protein
MWPHRQKRRIQRVFVCRQHWTEGWFQMRRSKGRESVLVWADAHVPFVMRRLLELALEVLPKALQKGLQVLEVEEQSVAV